MKGGGLCSHLVDEPFERQLQLNSGATMQNTARCWCQLLPTFSVFILIGMVVALTSVSVSAQRPPVSDRTAGISPHPLTTVAAFETLMQGGNAFDAGCTALLFQHPFTDGFASSTPASAGSAMKSSSAQIAEE